MRKRLLVKTTSKKFLALSAGALVIQASAWAQTNGPTVMKPTIVTGSYIPTAETIGAAPVSVVTPADIQKSGQQDVLSVLTKLDPAFSGSGNIGQVANNFSINGAVPSGEANVAIRNLPTLVLLNGLRLPNSALSGGQLVDLNTIPISIVDHVEILKDGASAAYGSDAIGGVVNVITKKNWSGTEISGRVGFPTRDDSNGILERRASIITGATGDDYSYFVGGQYYYMDPLLTHDRSISSLSIAQMQALGVNPPSYISPSYPGRVQDTTGSYILAGSPFAAGGPGYNPAIKTPPVYAGYVTATRATAVSDYNAYAIAHGYVDPTGNGLGPYIPLGLTPQGPAVAALSYPLLNTTQYGVHSIQTQDRRNFFANFEHDLFGKNLQVFATVLYANDLSRGELAPNPVPALNLYNITVPANNPFNPFGIDVGSVPGGGTPRVRSRFVDNGDRIFDAQSDTYHVVGGLKGEISPNYDWEATYNYNRADQIYLYRNAVNGAALNQSLAGTLTDPNGNVLPPYNIFALPGQNSAATIGALSTTLFNQGVSQLWNVDAHIHAHPFDLPAGPFDGVAGIQYINESLSLSIDGLQQLGLVPGLNQAYPFSGGQRDREAAFAEVKIPIFSEQWNIPGFYSLDVDVQGRYERIFPGGDAGVPKIQIRWQPVDNQLTLRGGYSQGFLAPSIYSLFGPDFVSDPFISIPGADAGQVQTQTRSNPNLPPSESQNWTAGIVYSPKQVKGLTFTVDYYNVTQDKVVVPGDVNAAAQSLNALGPASPYAAGFTTFSGAPLTGPGQLTVNDWGNLILTNSATAALRTDGLDIGSSYEKSTDTMGKYTFSGMVNWIHNYEIQSSPTKKYYRYEGLYTQGFGTSQGLIPDWRLNLGLTWEYQGFTYDIMGHYIPPVTDLGDLFGEVGNTTQDYTLNGKAWHVPDYFTIDMRLAYTFKESYGRILNGTTVAVGVNNITDEDPPLISSALEDNTDKGTYDLLGRFVYFEVSKTF